MHLIFGNPAGWWALLGIPALVLIHFLQRQSRRQEISTMFLLEKLEVESRAGTRIERWRNSTLFWLQVLAVLLIAWMLSEPRWVEAGTLQRVALVLDSSLAMEAFRPQIQKGLADDTSTLRRGANRTEWLLLESDISRPPLYRGEDRAAMLDALAKWHANLGPHDPAPVLHAARAAVGDQGLVFFVTYHPPSNTPLPVEAHVLAYGRVLDNVGVVAATVEQHDNQSLWRVLIHNYSATPQTRTYWIEVAGQKSDTKTIEMKPGETLAEQGLFPANTERMVFALSPDDFALDDRIPLVLAQPKQLGVAFHGTEDFVNYLKPIVQLVPQTLPVAGGAAPDLEFDFGGNDTITPLGMSRIYFSAETAEGTASEVRSRAAPEKNPLMDGLNWSGLEYHALPPAPPQRGDITLMWDGSLPLITLREPPGQGQTLIFNFNPMLSNAAHLPAFVLLLDRFAEQARLKKPAFARANFPSGQSLALVLPPGAKGAKLEILPMDAKADSANPNSATDLSLNAAAQAHAPSPPSFFTVKVDGKLWLDAASQFPDPRESDFHDAATIALDAKAQSMREEAHSHTDALTPLWLLALLGALLATWRETGKPVK
jgi:hypothetical protein